MNKYIAIASRSNFVEVNLCQKQVELIKKPKQTGITSHVKLIFCHHIS